MSGFRHPQPSFPLITALIISWRRVLLTVGLALGTAGSEEAEAADVEYLADTPGLIFSAEQRSGMLGRNVATHLADKTGAPLRIGEQTYARGLGQQANGNIIVLLDGRYAAFDATVGLQAGGTGTGSVIFRVFVDDRLKFDSGIMRAKDAAKPVHVALAGAAELRLELNDAGDGVRQDLGNWVDARLTPAAGTLARASTPTVDIAKFARVVTSDPRRTEGTKAKRTEEYPAADVFLETALTPDQDGGYVVAAQADGLGCIGLQWLNQRLLRELRLQFREASHVPALEAVRVERWSGESAWQGRWSPMPGKLAREGDTLVFAAEALANQADLTRKVRWIFPAPNGSVLVRRLAAFSRATWDEAKLVVEVVPTGTKGAGELSVFNGERAEGEGAPLKLGGVSRLNVRHSRASALKTDSTVLHFRLGSGAFGVAVEDVLNRGCVYLPEHGVIISPAAAPVTLAEHRQKIGAEKTNLQRVRELPDQTLAQALARTHHAAQETGPMLVSLACDNRKFQVDRDGTLRFFSLEKFRTKEIQALTNPLRLAEAAAEIRPQLGTGAPTSQTRQLEGGWLPIAITTSEKDGIVCRQRTFSAPLKLTDSALASDQRRSVCVAEFTLTNSRAKPAAANFSLSFLTRSSTKELAKLEPHTRGFVLLHDTEKVGLVATDGALPLTASIADGSLTLTGTLPAGASARCLVYLPSDPESFPAGTDVELLRFNVESYWRSLLATATQIETPDERLNNLIRASQVRCLIAARHEADGERIAPWIAAMKFGPLESEAHAVIRGMDLLGHTEFARRSLDFFISRYNSIGFLTTGYTTFGTPWHLWTVGEHYQWNRDTEWLRRAAPELARVAAWSVRQLEKTKSTSSLTARPPEHGLIPPGVLADWNAYAYHLCMDAYYFAALRDVGAALSALGQPEGAQFTREATELRENILHAYRWTQAQMPAVPLRTGAWVPNFPSQVHSPGKLADFFPGQDGGRSWCYDVELGAQQLVATGVFAPHDPEVTRMLDYLEDEQFLADGWGDYPASENHRDWFNAGGFSKVQPYYTRNGEIYALRDDVKPFLRSYFNTLASMVNLETLTFWEHFNHGGAWDKTHETGNFLQQTRFMLVMEHGEELRLAPLITNHWLKDGLRVSVKNAPTRFGPVSYQITSHVNHGAIEAIVEAPTRNPAQTLVLRLRHPEGRALQSVKIDGAPHHDFDPRAATIRFRPPHAKSVTVRASYSP